MCLAARLACSNAVGLAGSPGASDSRVIGPSPLRFVSQLVSYRRKRVAPAQ